MPIKLEILICQDGDGVEVETGFRKAAVTTEAEFKWMQAICELLPTVKVTGMEYAGSVDLRKPEAN